MAMTESEYWYNKLSAEQHQDQYTHESKMNYLVQQEEMSLFALLKPKVSVDGNQYCVLYGENLQEGIAGFGDTLMKAIFEFNLSFHKPLTHKN